MKYAIIAAGEGSRLANEGIDVPKPLIKIQGVPMIERLVNIFAEHNASSISIIVNSRQPETVAKVKEMDSGCIIDLIVKDTAGSMHSFHELSQFIRGEKFCLTTVDTIFMEEEFNSFIEALEECEYDGIMAVTDYIDDEKPLYIETDDELNITAFCDKPAPTTRYVSGGIYGLTPRAIEILDSCMEKGIERMRDFQRELVNSGMRLKAYPFKKIIDIDHAEDIAKAEKFLSEP